VAAVINFEVGQKVVCVDAKRTNKNNAPELVEGKIYTIRWIGPHTPYGDKEATICVRLVEVPSRDNSPSWLIDGMKRMGMSEQEINDYVIDHPFRATRFKPLQKKTTDISVFKEILNKANADGPKVLEKTLWRDCATTC
jgi:hypothetical protein